MKIPKEILRSCAGLGFAASSRPAMRDLALNIFGAIETAAPDNPAWILGTAMVYANCDNDLEKARDFMMKQGVSERSGSLLARAFLGIVLISGKHSSSGENMLRAVLADGSDADANKLARSALDNLRTGG